MRQPRFFPADRPELESLTMRQLIHSLEQVTPITASFLVLALLAGVAIGFVGATLF